MDAPSATANATVRVGRAQVRTAAEKEVDPTAFAISIRKRIFMHLIIFKLSFRFLRGEETHMIHAVVPPDTDSLIDTRQTVSQH